MERAAGGDLQPLADRLRNAKKLLQAESAMAADFLDGTRKVKNPEHRPPKDETRKQQMLLALDVCEQMHLGARSEKDAVELVCKARGKRKRTVQDAVFAHPEMFAGLKRRVRARK